MNFLADADLVKGVIATLGILIFAAIAFIDTL